MNNNLVIVKRIQRHATRKTHLEINELDLKDSDLFLKYQLPFQSETELLEKIKSIQQLETKKCESCHQQNIQWWIFPISELSNSNNNNNNNDNNNNNNRQFNNPIKSFQVYTNGVVEGLKCNTCKEEFLRKYLHPNWFCDVEKKTTQLGTNWQPFGLLEISTW